MLACGNPKGIQIALLLLKDLNLDVNTRTEVFSNPASAYGHSVFVRTKSCALTILIASLTILQNGNTALSIAFEILDPSREMYTLLDKLMSRMKNLVGKGDQVSGSHHFREYLLIK